jgi:hypothetical protein
MGYNLHITRADDWVDSERQPIRAQEWLAVVAEDPELRLHPTGGPYLAVWPGPCRYPDGTWFDWLDGRVFTKHPDRATVAKMLQLAARLGARVQGDHGEWYTAPVDMPWDEESRPAGERPRRPWWRFW